MPKELNPEEFQHELETHLTPEAREWVARMLHDHVSGLVTNLSMQVEIVRKMLARGMDLNEEVESLKHNVSAATSHIVMIEKMIRPKKTDEN